MHCYSKTILSNDTPFNYYKQAYCDQAIFGLYGMATVVGVALATIMTFWPIWIIFYRKQNKIAAKLVSIKRRNFCPL